MTDVAGGPVYAGFWRRFWALVIDTIIMGLALAAVAVPVLLWSGISLESDLTDVSEWGDRAGAIAYAADFVLWWLYFSIMESSPLQATLGKMALSIRVTDTGRATDQLLARDRAHLGEDHLRRHPPDRIHHGGIHRAQAGAARHHRPMSRGPGPRLIDAIVRADEALGPSSARARHQGRPRPR